MSRYFSLAGIALTLGISFGAAANPVANAARSPSVGEVRATLANMPKGDVQRGRALHQSLMCASCHGDRGTAPSRNWSSLAGQRAAYTYKSLLDYQRNGRHEDARATLMHVVVQGMSRQDMADVARYYASLPAQAAAARQLGATARKHAEQLVRHGDPARLITPCASCHGAAGLGGINETPALAGQTLGSFVNTMRDYRNGRRITDANQGMRQFAQRLTLGEIEDLAVYYAGLPSKRR